MKDLFEFHNEQPKELKTICDKWAELVDEGLDFEQCEEYKKEVESIGYTFDFEFDAQPFNLRLVKYARKCNASGEGINEGFCFGDGEAYFKEESDALKYAISIGYKDLDEAYLSDAYYHTEWHHTLEDEDNFYSLKGLEYNHKGELILPVSSSMKTLFLNYELEPTNSQKDATFLLRYSYDYSFDKRGILLIEHHVLNDGTTFRNSFALPIIYDFMQTNKELKTSIGKYTFEDEFIESFKDVENLNEDHILALLNVSLELNNSYRVKQTKEEFLKY